jgi:hypothetical protein
MGMKYQTTSTIPTTGKEQNLLEMECGLSSYCDTQTAVSIQEMLECYKMI